LLNHFKAINYVQHPRAVTLKTRGNLLFFTPRNLLRKKVESTHHSLSGERKNFKDHMYREYYRRGVTALQQYRRYKRNLAFRQPKFPSVIRRRRFFSPQLTHRRLR